MKANIAIGAALAALATAGVVTNVVAPTAAPTVVAADTVIPPATKWILINGWPLPDSSFKYPGIIAVDSATGNLRSDLGWMRGSFPARHIIACYVATHTPTTKWPVWKPVLLGPNSSTVRPLYLWTDCYTGFQQWVKAESLAAGKWPASP